jgi:CxxC motif-containing protein (DUF1111 family)
VSIRYTTRGVLLPCACLLIVVTANAQTDPGVRPGAAAAGSALSGLSVKEAKFFAAGQDAFAEVASVSGTIAGTEPGLGPRFNLTSCGGCHAHPAVGGSSPQTNPQVSIAPAVQVNPLVQLKIITANGPVREVRFRSDGGVHALFTIMGRSDTPPGCNIPQPDFAGRQSELVFRIPTPTFGLGLIEAIADATILANQGSTGKPTGVIGHANRNGNDGTVTRFGWKAQNKSLVIFSGEAYNVEQGVTNALFPDERGEGGVQDPAACRTNSTPEDHVHYDDTQPQAVPDDASSFANFMRFLAPPAPVMSYTSTKSAVGAVSADSIIAGLAQFKSVGCAACHIVSMQTGAHSSAALASQTVSLYSDLLVHNMGDVLADGVSQGNAGGNEFRTAPLWGLGQRIFLLHDGRTSDLTEAIAAHAGEATSVITKYNTLSPTDKQNLLNFLRSL